MDWGKVDEAMSAAAFPQPNDASSNATNKNSFNGRNSDVFNKYKNGDYVFPGAVLLVGHRGEIVYHNAFGCRSIIPEVTPMSKDMVFDIASLTKVMVTTLLVMHTVERGGLTVDKKLSHIFQTFGTLGKERLTVRHLLTHCSGYPATHPYYRVIAKADEGDRAGVMTSKGAAEMVYNEIFRGKLENLPGKVTKYSDIGFILLGRAIETICGGASLDKLAIKHLISPLKLNSTGFVELAKIRRRGLEPISETIVPTLNCPWRNKILCGEVHDDNAWAMGGIAGHAGLFSCASDIHSFASEMINCWRGCGSLLSQEIVKTFWTRDNTVPESTWALGWDTPSKNNSSSGSFFSEHAVGHLGYTGCSLWIDPLREVDVILLSNRIHPSDTNNSIKQFRPIIHDLVMTALGYGAK